MEQQPIIRGKDIPITKLSPLNEREINEKQFKKIIASIERVGLLEPLIVYEESGRYIILDGYLRYKACLELGAETIPCILHTTKEAYTPNRMVNKLTAVQQSKMIRRSLEVLDQKTVAETLGLKNISYSLKSSLISTLHDDILKAIDDETITIGIANDLSFVNKARQKVIYDAMVQSGDMSVQFARTLVLRTPAKDRNKNKKGISPWDYGGEKKSDMVKKLQEAEQRHDFYSGLYRQYVSDLIKMCIYVRKLTTIPSVRDYLESKYKDMLTQFETIIFETENK